MSDEEPIEIEFMCKYCLRSHKIEFDGWDDWDYPDICPYCLTTQCGECNEIIKAGATFCMHCGEIAPEYRGNMVRTTSTSAGYAEWNWGERVRRWNNNFGELEDEDREWRMWGGINETIMKEETVDDDGNKKTLEEREVTDEELDRIKERKEEIEKKIEEAEEFI